MEELTEFLHSEAEVSLAERGYEYACGWVAANLSQFSKTVERGERYGVLDRRKNLAIINRIIWNRMCEQAGFSSKSLLSGLKDKGLLELGGKGYTKTCWLDGVPAACVWLRLPVDEGSGYEDEPLL